MDFHPSPSIPYRLKSPFWTAPQKRLFDRSWNEPRFAAFHEPRTGKSKPMVDTACAHFQLQDELFVRGFLAITWPAGGHVGWVADAWPESATVPWKGLIWDSGTRLTKTFKRAFDDLLTTTRMAVLSVNIEALISEGCREAIGRFAVARKKIMGVGDEISAVANSDTRRARIMHNVGRLPHVVMHRILDGTPVDRKGPLDYYSEFGFMGFDILGYENELEFRHHYAEIENKGRQLYWGEVGRLKREGKSKEVAEKLAKGAVVTDQEIGRKRRLVRGRDYWSVIKEDSNGTPIFKNMAELRRRIDPITDRCTYIEAFPDSARQVFAKRYFQLTAEQRRVYDQLDSELRATLHDGSDIKAAHHLTRTLRLQQVASNYYPDHQVLRLHETCGGLGCALCEDSGVLETTVPLKLIDVKSDPRAEALAQEMREGKTSIVWVRFRQDGDVAMKVCADAGASPVRYYGIMSAKEREENRDIFQVQRKAGAIVAQWTRGARAVRMDAADKHVAYSNQWSYRTRVQAQQRSEHGSKRWASSFVDLVAYNTVDDQQIIPALRTGKDVSAFVLGDKREEWI